jgi:hypothetical protein
MSTDYKGKLDFLKGTNIRKALGSNLVVLQKITLITEDIHADDPFFSELREIYKINQELDAIERFPTTIANAAVTQGREYFVITRDSLRALGKLDKNWTNNLGFRDSTYPTILAGIHKSHFIAMVLEGNDHQPAVLRITNQTILERLSLSPEESERQKNEAIQFAKGGTIKGHRSGNLEMEKPSNTGNKEREESSKKGSEDQRNNEMMNERMDLRSEGSSSRSTQSTSKEEMQKESLIHDFSPCSDLGKPQLVVPPTVQNDKEDTLSKFADKLSVALHSKHFVQESLRAATEFLNLNEINIENPRDWFQAILLKRIKPSETDEKFIGIRATLLDQLVAIYMSSLSERVSQFPPGCRDSVWFKSLPESRKQFAMDFCDYLFRGLNNWKKFKTKNPSGIITMETTCFFQDSRFKHHAANVDAEFVKETWKKFVPEYFDLKLKGGEVSPRFIADVHPLYIESFKLIDEIFSKGK